MLDTDAPMGVSEPTDATAAPVRRRRAASRPAGPPKPLEAPVIETPAADAPEAEVTEVRVEDAAAIDPDAAVSPEPDLVTDAEAEVEADAEVEVDADPSASGDDQAVDDQASDAPVAAEVAPAPSTTTRAPRRRSRATAAPAATVTSQAEAATEAEDAAEAPASSEPAEPVDEGAPARRPARRRSTRRPASDPTAEAAADPEAGLDPLAESLSELTGRAARRTKAPMVANPFSAESVTAALDDLAAAIGGRPAASAEDDSDDHEDDPTLTDDLDLDLEGEGDADGDDSPRRRRRRRGGRRRRRGSDERADASDDDTEDAEASEGDEDADPSAEASEDDAEDATEGVPSANGRRRRRRRRRGEDTGVVEDEGVEVVVKVREPRRAKSPSDEITGIEGSTRMEAKRQRRKEGRAAGRRRAPILSETEFLARRESVDRMMLIRQTDDYTQIGVLEDGVLVEHYVDRDSSASMIGNVYLGRVQNVLPSMEAAFIDIGRGRNAVLYAGEVDWDAYGTAGPDRKVEKVLKSGQPVLVQVTKDPVGAKGARLTNHVSIPGRYVVYSPGGQLSGISRKLPEAERARLKSILDEVVGADASVIVRTAAEGAAEDELVRDVNRLKAQWEIIEKKVKAGNAPQLLYSEPDLTVRIVRDLFTEDFSTLIVDGNGQGEDAYDTVSGYVTHVAPHLAERLRHWDRATEGDLFTRFRVTEQVAKALERKVHLPSGGSLIIDRTEAMTVIDVNTGKFTGTQGNLEATVTSNNLEAAEEIVRQLRLRDIGGIIVVDFIDMVLPANRELLLRRLVECLGRDRTRHQVAEVTSLGLVQLTRKKIGTGLAEAFTVSCDTCSGRGYHTHDAPVTTQAAPDGGDRDHGRRQRGRAVQPGPERRALPAPAAPVAAEAPASPTSPMASAQPEPAEEAQA